MMTQQLLVLSLTNLPFDYLLHTTYYILHASTYIYFLLHSSTYYFFSRSLHTTQLHTFPGELSRESLSIWSGNQCTHAFPLNVGFGL